MELFTGDPWFQRTYDPTIDLLLAAILNSDAILKFETDRGSFPDRNIYTYRIMASTYSKHIDFLYFLYGFFFRKKPPKEHDKYWSYIVIVE